MTIIVSIERRFPPEFLAGTNSKDKTTSSSEKLGKAALLLAFGYGEKNLIRGNPDNFEPDFFTADNYGFEITFADNREGNQNGSIARLKNGQFQIHDMETDIMYSINESLKDKKNKKQKGGYKKISNVSVFVISVEPLLYWYGDLKNFHYPHTQKNRNVFFQSLYQDYIESSIFDNIFIMQLTEYQSFVLFNVKGFAQNSSDCITELKSKNPNSLPNCIITKTEMIDDGSSLVRYEYHDVFFQY